MNTDSGFYTGIEPPFTWHNDALPSDVNGDGAISPLDASLIVTELNLREFSDEVTSELVPPSADSTAFLDPNNDGFVSPSDAAIVIASLPTSSQAALSLVVSGESVGTTDSIQDVRDLVFELSVLRSLDDAEGADEVAVRHLDDVFAALDVEDETDER